jgi:hypothetical protein
VKILLSTYKKCLVGLKWKVKEDQEED